VKAAGVPSGYDCVRDCIKTYGNSDLIVIAARPGMGKTAYAVGEAIEMAKMGIPVLFFSLEMSKQQIVARMLSYLTEIDVDTILKATYDDSERRVIDKAMDVLRDLKILVDDSSPSPVQIASKARRAKIQHKIGAVVVDYLQIIPHHEKNRSRNDEISYISGSLKRLAKHLDVPVMVLSQLSRDVEKRGDKRPMLSDLRDGGSIEQDADMVCFLYRPSYYGETKSDGSSYDGEAEVIIAKHRNGSTGNVQIGFKANCAKYHDFKVEYKF
jgi:replicative DNA helicase